LRGQAHGILIAIKRRRKKEDEQKKITRTLETYQEEDLN
jgi:hypothetical protein